MNQHSINLDFPLHFDYRGRTAFTDDADHVRDMIEQLLFTNPGERVNRPDFGCGLLAMVFAPNSPELATALQFTIQASLQRWLSDLVEIRTLTVTSDDASLRVSLEYAVRRTGEQRIETFERRMAV
jgi:phage baseplate assembly protein W